MLAVSVLALVSYRRGGGWRHPTVPAPSILHAREQPVTNGGHDFLLITIRRLTPYNLGSPTGLPAARRRAGVEGWSDAHAWTERNGARVGRGTLQGSWRVVLGCKPGSSGQLTTCCCQALVHWRSIPSQTSPFPDVSFATWHKVQLRWAWPPSAAKCCAAARRNSARSP